MSFDFVVLNFESLFIVYNEMHLLNHNYGDIF